MCASEESKCASVRISPCALPSPLGGRGFIGLPGPGKVGTWWPDLVNRRANLIIFSEKEALLLSALESPPSGPPDLSLRRTAVLNTVPVTRAAPPPQAGAPPTVLCSVWDLETPCADRKPPSPRRPPSCHLAAQPQSLGSCKAPVGREPCEDPKDKITPESVFLTLFSVVFDRHRIRQSFAV